MATAGVNRAGGAAFVIEHQVDSVTFEGALASFKGKLLSLDNGEDARKALEGIGRFMTARVIDPGDGIKWCFEGLGLPQDLIDDSERLDSYVKQQISYEATEKLKRDIKQFAQHFGEHIQKSFQSCDELLELGKKLELAGQKKMAVHAFYKASLKAIVDSNLGKLEEAAAKIKDLDPEMGSLDLQQRTHFLAQITIVELNKKLAVAKRRIEVLEKVMLKSTAEEYGFGPENWAKYFGDVGEVPLLPPDIEGILAGPCPYWEGKKVRDTHMLMLVPASVDGKPFNLNLLGELIQSPKNGGHTNKYKYVQVKKEKILSEASEHSYWLLMTKDVIPDSRAKSYAEQLDLLQSPYEAPKMLEAATVMSICYLRTGQRLCGEDPHTITRCWTPLSKGFVLAVEDSLTYKEPAPAGVGLRKGPSAAGIDHYCLMAVRRL